MFRQSLLRYASRNLFPRNYFFSGTRSSSLIDINHDVVDSSKPLVALESTIITHGMPYPKNLEMALQVEQEIESFGARPVTIGYINGRLKAGLTRSEIEMLAKNTSQAIKISRRDLPFILSNRSDKPLYGGIYSGYCTKVVVILCV